MTNHSIVLPTATTGNPRIHILDILRGFALMGILAANIPGIIKMPSPANGERGYNVHSFVELAVEQRFFPIFCLLFGIGFAIFMRNAQNKGVSPYWLMARRLGLLALFGILHQVLQPGEALLSYAIVGFLILAMYKLPPKWLIVAAALFLALFGFVQIEQLIIPAMFCCGMFLSKIGYFENLTKFRKATFITWIISLALVFPALWAQVNIILPTWPSPLATAAGLVIAVAMVTSILLLPRAETLLAWLSPFGRMALTNYIMQTILIQMASLSTPRLSYASIPVVWVVIISIQILFSAVWLRYFESGPLEWVWRWGTYLRVPRFTRDASPQAA